MPVIETKYGVGDAVWHANVTTATRQHPCPDCMGSREWEAHSPAGGIFKIACPRCGSQYQSRNELNLKYSWWAPSATRRTIGQVRAYTGPDGKNEYMCHETGIGSGNIYYEDRLFATEADAMAAAQAMADANNADPEGWVAKQFKGSLQVSDYELKDAVMAAAKSDARSAIVRIEMLLEELSDARDIGEVSDLIRSWRERDGSDQ